MQAHWSLPRRPGYLSEGQFRSGQSRRRKRKPKAAGRNGAETPAGPATGKSSHTHTHTHTPLSRGGGKSGSICCQLVGPCTVCAALLPSVFFYRWCPSCRLPACQAHRSHTRGSRCGWWWWWWCRALLGWKAAAGQLYCRIRTFFPLPI
ncbi:hypothetical protein LZ32DRAFT_94105 [Colletotrichum eremochloae]|nr:hypothetical protein LZ32DRAFT_94105 [Colletotrichum eremochloae]